MSAVTAAITITDDATPLLAELLRRSTQTARTNRIVASRLAVGTSDHIHRAALTRHKTAKAMGYLPTGYLGRRAQSMAIDETGESLSVSIDGAPEIFARVRAGVLILPTNGRKYLTIPCDKEVHDKRAKSIPESTFKAGTNPITGRKGFFLWAAFRGPFRPLFQLVKKVFLPRDEGLLPNRDEVIKLLEQGAIDVIEYETELTTGGTRDALARTVVRPEDNAYRGRTAPL